VERLVLEKEQPRCNEHFFVYGARYLLQTLFAKRPEQVAKLVPEKSSHEAISLLPVTAKARSGVGRDAA
jgi:hypothetical protein